LRPRTTLASMYSKCGISDRPMKKNATHSTSAWISLGVFAALMLVPTKSDAFCGFYVAPSDAPLYNDASMVALMREGTRTALSMSNNYRGHWKTLRWWYRCPLFCRKKTLRPQTQKCSKSSSNSVLRVWSSTGNRTVPEAPPSLSRGQCENGAAGSDVAVGRQGRAGRGLRVKIEAQFTVGEYEIVVLSAEESTGLERYLVDNKYKIPTGAADALAPYVKEQQKFFVAKVDAKKVKRDAQGVVVLSPLRVHFEDPNFRLPVRLGLLNAEGKQDLLVYVLATSGRYETANYPNAFVPTNLDVKNETRAAFGPFYAALFDAALAKAGGRAVVTEYSWQSSSCDPCPTPPLTDGDIATLGGDALMGMKAPAAGTDSRVCRVAAVRPACFSEARQSPSCLPACTRDTTRRCSTKISCSNSASRSSAVVSTSLVKADASKKVRRSPARITFKRATRFAMRGQGQSRATRLGAECGVGRRRGITVKAWQARCRRPISPRPHAGAFNLRRS